MKSRKGSRLSKNGGTSFSKNEGGTSYTKSFDNEGNINEDQDAVKPFHHFP